MSHVTWPWRIFLVIEFVAVVADLTSTHIMSELGPVLWVVGFVLTLPGTYATGWLVEHALWNTGLGLSSIFAVELLVAVAFNALVWAFGILVVRATVGALRSNKALERSRDG